MGFTEHAIEAMKKRDVTREDVLHALNEADLRAVDTLTGHFVAVKRDDKWLVVVYDVHGEEITVVTAYLVSRKAQIENRLRNGRWVEI